MSYVEDVYDTPRLFDNLSDVNDGSASSEFVTRSMFSEDMSSAPSISRTSYSRAPKPTEAKECPVGYRYRKEYDVPGGCVTNFKNMVTVHDTRCPAGMHWRKTFTVKAGCSRSKKQQLKKKWDAQKTLQLPACDENLVNNLVAQYMKVIASDLKEYFLMAQTNPQRLQDDKVMVKLQKRILKSIHKKLMRQNCAFRPTQANVASINNMISNALREYNEQFGFSLSQYKAEDQGIDRVWIEQDNKVTAKAVARPTSSRRSSSSTLSTGDALTSQDMQKLYELYYLFESYNQKTAAQLSDKGQHLFAQYNALFQKLAEQNKFQLDDSQLLQYIQNYGESQLEPVTLVQLNNKYGGPFWTQSSVVIHCPHCNNPISVSNYEPNAVLQCPICHQTMKLT